MRYNEKIQLKLYNKNFILQAIIDDYNEISFAHNLYEAGDFSISINYNIPNALLFQRGLFVQFGNDPYMFGEILSVTDSIAQDGKGSQMREIKGKDARFLFKRRVIKNMNSEGLWVMTAKGELCLRNLILDQCGENAEEKRRLPIINNIPESANAIGKEYSVSESFSNLYDTLVTIATQSEIGWRVKFNGNLELEVFQGEDLSSSIQFSTDFDSLSNGTFTDTSESYANSIYVAGKGTGNDRDIYEGEIEAPEGLDRYEAYDNQSGMTTENEYEAEALSMLSQYGQTITVAGNGLAKSPYTFKEQYNIGDIITIAFSGKSAKAQILNVTEHWAFGQYGCTFSFGKPVNDLNRQMQLILKQIQKASNKTTTTSSVKYYTIPTDTQMPKSDVIYDTIGFIGECAADGSTFKLYLDEERTGAKTYHIYFKQLAGGKLTLTTGVTGASNLVLNSGTYVAIIFVDASGNVTSQGMTATNTVETGNNQPVTSDGVNTIIDKLETEISGKQPLLTAGANIKIDNNVIEGTSDLPTDAVLHYSFDELPDYPDGTADVRLLNNNTYDIQSTSYKCLNGGGTVFSSDGGNVKAVISSGAALNGLRINYTSAKIIKIKFRVTELSGGLRVMNGFSTGSEVLGYISEVGEYEQSAVFNMNVDDVNKGFGILLRNKTDSATVVIEQIYIGDGSYSTPVIDNANGKWNSGLFTGITVQGIAGKALKQFSNTSIVVGNYNFNNNFTISIWVNPERQKRGRGTIFEKRNVVRLLNGAEWLGGYNNLHLSVFTDTEHYYNFGSLLPINQWINIVVLKNANVVKFYLNGVMALNVVLPNADLAHNSNNFILNGNCNKNQTYDDLLIFDRALTETEVKALYYNKANTPKYYNLNNYKLPAPPTTDGSYTLNVTVSGGVPSYSWS
jgi:hypothetical protein